MFLHVYVTVAVAALTLVAVESFSVNRAQEDAADIGQYLAQRDSESMLRRRRSFADDSGLPPYDFPKERAVAPYFQYRSAAQKRGRLDELIARLSRMYGPSNSRGHPMRFATGR